MKTLIDLAWRDDILYGMFRASTTIVLLIIFAILAPATLTSSGIKSSFAQPESDSKPIIVALFRGDVNQTALVSLYKQYLTDTDYVAPILTSDWEHAGQLPGEKMLTAGSLKELSWKISQFKDKATWAVYDLEYFSTMTGVPPEYIAEYEDYVNSVKKASEMAHQNGLHLMLTPVYKDIKQYSKEFAPYVDMVNLQIPHFRPDYADEVKTAVENIKSINPNAKVVVQLIPRERDAGKLNGDPSDIIAAWKSVKDKADGVLVFYYKEPDPVPILEEFYDGIGLNRNNINATSVLLSGTSADTSVRIGVNSSLPKVGERMQIEVSFADANGNGIQQMNYDMTAMQDGEVILDVSSAHGNRTYQTLLLLSDKPVDVSVTLIGIGPVGQEADWIGPKGEVISLRVIPEFFSVQLTVFALSMVLTIIMIQSLHNRLRIHR